MISGNVPQHLVVAARTGFLTALKATPMPWQRVAMTLVMGAKAVDLVDLGAAPMPVNSKSGITVQDFVEKTKEVKPIDWDITTFISYNAIQDDQTGTLERRVRSAGENFQKHINNRVFDVLDAGDSTTYGLCYDGQDFFDSDHIDKGGAYQTNQDNENALALSLDNFQTVYIAAQKTRDDQGQFSGYTYDLLVVPPDLEYTAAQITGNAAAYDTANRENNPYSGKLSYVVSPQLSTTAWMLVASGESIKPLIVAMRQQPFLQDAWFDPTAPEGGRYYFKYFGRYEVHYGDWHLAYLGNT